MIIIEDFFVNQQTDSILQCIGVSVKATFFALIFILVLGFIASALERLINLILGGVLGSGFTLLFCNYLTFPGTILHELSHALAATITGAKVKEISFFDLGVSLGHVTYITRGPKFMKSLQDSFTACAPIISGSLALLTLYSAISGTSHSMGITVLLIYLTVCVIDHMTMSIIDAINFFKGIWALAILIFAVSLCICFVV